MSNDSYKKEGDDTTLYSPWEWENGMYPAIFITDGVEYTQPITKVASTNRWYACFPIPRGSYHYYYGVIDTAGDYKTMGTRNANMRTDSANPPPLLPDFRSSSSDYLSVAFGVYDPQKQSSSDDCTTWKPVKMNDPTAKADVYESKTYIDIIGRRDIWASICLRTMIRTARSLIRPCICPPAAAERSMTGLPTVMLVISGTTVWRALRMLRILPAVWLKRRTMTER